MLPALGEHDGVVGVRPHTDIENIQHQLAAGYSVYGESYRQISVILLSP